jgi:hypothetical protein
VCPLDASANVLQVIIVELPGPESIGMEQCLTPSMADKRLRIISAGSLTATTTASSEATSPAELHVLDSPAIGLVVVARRYVVLTMMAGGMGVLDLQTREIVASRMDHTKYAMQVVATPAKNFGRVLRCDGGVG